MVLTVAELALAVGRSENYIRQHIHRKHLTARKDGRSVFVALDEASRWARERGLPFVRQSTQGQREPWTIVPLG